MRLCLDESDEKPRRALWAYGILQSCRAGCAAQGATVAANSAPKIFHLNFWSLNLQENVQSYWHAPRVTSPSPSEFTIANVHLFIFASLGILLMSNDNSALISISLLRPHTRPHLIVL